MPCRSRQLERSSLGSGRGQPRRVLPCRGLRAPGCPALLGLRPAGQQSRRLGIRVRETSTEGNGAPPMPMGWRPVMCALDRAAPNQTEPRARNVCFCRSHPPYMLGKTACWLPVSAVFPHLAKRGLPHATQLAARLRGLGESPLRANGSLVASPAPP